MEHGDVVSALREPPHDFAADEERSTNHEDSHSAISEGSAEQWERIQRERADAAGHRPVARVLQEGTVAQRSKLRVASGRRTGPIRLELEPDLITRKHSDRHRRRDFAEERAGIRRRDRRAHPAGDRRAAGFPLGAEVNNPWCAGGAEELECVDQRYVFHVQDSSPVVHLEIDGRLAHVKRPEEARRKNAAVEVVKLRPRTGVIDVDSYQRERSSMNRAVHHVLPLERSDVGLEVVRRTIAAPGGADMIGNRSRAIEVRQRPRLHVESRGRQPGERKRHGGIARRKNVNDEARSQFESARNRIRHR